MCQRLLRLCPGKGEKSARFSRDSGIFLSAKTTSILTGTSTNSATNGFSKITRSSVIDSTPFRRVNYVRNLYAER